MQYGPPGTGSKQTRVVEILPVVRVRATQYYPRSSVCDAALAGDLDSVKAKLQEASRLEGYSMNAKGTRSRTSSLPELPWSTTRGSAVVVGAGRPR